VSSQSIDCIIIYNLLTKASYTLIHKKSSFFNYLTVKSNQEIP